MSVYHQVHVALSRKDRRRIGEMLNKGRESARVLRRAWILRQLDQSQSAVQTAASSGAGVTTVRAIARRCKKQGYWMRHCTRGRVQVSYERCGTTNAFCGVEPKAGRNFTRITASRSAAQFADYLVEIVAASP